MPRSPHGPRRTGVHVHSVLLGPHVRAAVHFPGRGAEVRRTRAVGATRSHRPERDGRQCAVLFRGHLQFLDRRRTVAHGQELVLAGRNHLHGTAQALRHQRRHDRVLLDAQLAAEPGTHEVVDHTNLVEWNLENVSQPLLNPERRLGALPDRQPVAFPVHHTHVRLQRGVMNNLGAIRIFHNSVSFGKTFLHVAALVDPRFAVANVSVFEQPRGIRFHGLLSLQNKRQLLVLHVNSSKRLFQGNLGLGDHKRHFVAFVADVGIEEEGVAVPANLRRVRVGHDAQYTGYLFRLRSVDLADPGMWNRGTQHPAESHARELDIHREPGVARGASVAVHPGVSHARHAKRLFRSPGFRLFFRNLGDRFDEFVFEVENGSNQLFGRHHHPPTRRDSRQNRSTKRAFSVRFTACSPTTAPSPHSPQPE